MIIKFRTIVSEFSFFLGDPVRIQKFTGSVFGFEIRKLI